MAENKKVIAVDLGGTNLRVGIVKGKRIIKYRKESTPKTQKELLKLLVSMISESFTEDIKGIGVSSAGPLLNGVIKNPPNLALKNFDLKRFLEKKFRKKTIIENDANCAALAELKFGQGRKRSNFIVLTIGTGIGGGVIIDKKLYKGEGYGGELGQIILDKGINFENLAACYM